MRFSRFLLERNMTYAEALQVFGITKEEAKDKDALNKKWRKLAMQHHPDRGGTVEMMQKINVAYDILKVGKSTTTGPSGDTRSDDEKRREQEEKRRQRKKEREERQQQSMERQRYVLNLLKDSFQPEAFVNYFLHLTDKEFDYDLEWDRVTPTKDLIGFKCTFESNDLEISIPFNVFTSHLYDKVDKKVIDLNLETYVFYKNKKHKITKSNIVRIKSSDLSKPDKLFPKTKMNKIFSGQKKGKFTKKDMLTYLKTRVNADIQTQGNDVWARIPIGDDLILLMYRVTMMREASWGINGVYEKNKRINQLPTAFFLENEETAKFIGEMVNQVNKKKSNDAKIKVLEKIINDYKKQTGM